MRTSDHEQTYMLISYLGCEWRKLISFPIRAEGFNLGQRYLYWGRGNVTAGYILLMYTFVDVCRRGQLNS